MELRNTFSTKREQLEEAESLPTLLLEAIDYLRLFYQEQSLPESHLQERLRGRLKRPLAGVSLP